LVPPNKETDRFKLSVFYRKFTTRISFFNYILLFAIFSILVSLVSKNAKSMKKALLKCALLVISFSLLSATIFAQEPLDPGNDPMQADSATYIVPLKPAESNNLASGTNLSPLKKDKDLTIKKSADTPLSKDEKEEGSRIIF